LRQAQSFVTSDAPNARGGVSPSSSGFGSSNSFAAIAGRGLEFQLCERVSLRAIEADCYYTRFNYRANDRQNNLRIGAGLVFHLGERYAEIRVAVNCGT